MKSPILPLLLGLAAPALAGLEDARALLKSDPSKAAETLRAQLAARPEDPWLHYNAGVAAYAAKEFSKADETWQQLAAAPMPDALREHVWTQIGNVSYRLAEPQIADEPDAAVSRLEQSREAYRVAIAFNKRNKTAQQNLPIIEKQLETVYARLAQRLAQEGKKENSTERAIEKLQAALTYAQQAQALNAQDPKRAEERKEIEKALAEKFNKQALQEEKQGDQSRQSNQWERQNAQEQFEKALTDFQQAGALDAQDPTAKEGEQRVQEKLANSFNKAARDQQREGMQHAKSNPHQATEKLEEALENFENALAQMPEHRDAQAGKNEVTDQLAKLHLDQGDRQAQRGEEQKPRDPAQAAENLLGALEHFEQAKALEPENETIQPRIDRVEAQLPDLLTQLGQREQQQAEKSEAQNAPQSAVAHLEKAESSFQKAQELQPGNAMAQQGEQQVQEDLARLRQQIAQKAEQQQQGKPKGNESKESFESMLAKVKKDETERDVQARHRAGQKYSEQAERGFRNW
jgi:tetratricopeptide (TPR) repeat protein